MRDTTMNRNFMFRYKQPLPTVSCEHVLRHTVRVWGLGSKHAIERGWPKRERGVHVETQQKTLCMQAKLKVKRHAAERRRLSSGCSMKRHSMVSSKSASGICPYGICCPWVHGRWGLDALGKAFRRRGPRPLGGGVGEEEFEGACPPHGFHGGLGR